MARAGHAAGRRARWPREQADQACAAVVRIISLPKDVTMKLWPGKPYPLGATWDGAGGNFLLFSENATKVELCLFDRNDDRREIRIPMTEQTHQVWHVYLPEVRAGQFYG